MVIKKGLCLDVFSCACVWREREKKTIYKKTLDDAGVEDVQRVVGPKRKQLRRQASIHHQRCYFVKQEAIYESDNAGCTDQNKQKKNKKHFLSFFSFFFLLSSHHFFMHVLIILRITQIAHACEQSINI